MARQKLDRFSVSQYLKPRVLGRWSGRATTLAILGTFLGLAVVPARVVVEARATVQSLAGESDTGVVVVSAPFDGSIRAIRRASGETVERGDVLIVMDTSLIAVLHTAASAEFASAEADLEVARTRALSEEMRAKFDVARSQGERERARAEATATGGMRDPLFADEFRHRRDAARAYYLRTKSRLETITEVHRLGAVSDRAKSDALAEAARSEAEYHAAESALERAEAPLSDTLAAPRHRESASAATLAAITGLTTQSNVEAAAAAVVATEMRLRRAEVEVDRLEDYLNRAVIVAPRPGVVVLTPGVEEGVVLPRGQSLAAISPSEKRVAVAEVPEWAYSAFDVGAEIVARPEATDRVVIRGLVISRGFVVFEKLGLLGPERFITAQVEFDTAPIPLPPGSTVMMEATHASGPLIWVIAKTLTAPQNAKFALGW